MPEKGILTNIFEGISKALTVKIDANMGLIAAEFNVDLSKLAKTDGQISVKDFNQTARIIFKKECIQYQMYFLIDELVFSRIDRKEDEITLRAAMVRDIMRSAWELNNYCAKNDLSFHFICSLRPEIRNLINDFDSESGKYLDGKDVELTWFSNDGSGENLLIYEVLKRKVTKSSFNVDFEEFLVKEIKFGNKVISIEDFLITNTWGRPRDVVRLLIAIQKKSPNSTKIGEAEVKAALDEYSRMSLKELVDELGVRYGNTILDCIRNGIRKKNYKNVDELWNSLNLNKLGYQKDRIMNELFHIGLFGGIDRKSGHFFWAHRSETYLKPDKEIIIHAALWNELSIRNT